MESIVCYASLHLVMFLELMYFEQWILLKYYGGEKLWNSWLGNKIIFLDYISSDDLSDDCEINLLICKYSKT